PGACCALSLVLVACQKPETPEQAQARMTRELAAGRPAFDAVARSYERYVAAGQSDSMAMLFTEQGEEMPPNHQPVVGRSAIQAFEAQQASLGQSTLNITTEEALVNGPLAISRGGYTLAIKPGPHAPAGMKAIADTG